MQDDVLPASFDSTDRAASFWTGTHSWQGREKVVLRKQFIATSKSSVAGYKPGKADLHFTIAKTTLLFKLWNSDKAVTFTDTSRRQMQDISITGSGKSLNRKVPWGQNGFGHGAILYYGTTQPVRISTVFFLMHWYQAQTFHIAWCFLKAKAMMKRHLGNYLRKSHPQRLAPGHPLELVPKYDFKHVSSHPTSQGSNKIHLHIAIPKLQLWYGKVRF